jgi:hypothetical protein
VVLISHITEESSTVTLLSFWRDCQTESNYGDVQILLIIFADSGNFYFLVHSPKGLLLILGFHSDSLLMLILLVSVCTV